MIPAAVQFNPFSCPSRFRVRFGFVTLGSRVPSTRFRFLPYIPGLEQNGHRVQVWMSFPSVYEHIPWLGWRASHLLKRSIRRAQVLAARRLQPDCIYLERGCLNDDSLDLDQRFRRQTQRLVLDVDDGIFLERPRKIDALIDMSDHCIVSNELIAEYVRPRHAHVTVIPTSVSMQRYALRPAPQTDAERRLVIGWIGTLPNLPFLSVCAEALRKLARQHDFELLIVAPHAEPLAQVDLAGVRVNFQRWTAESEIQQLHRMDIGIMPLPTGQAWMQYKAATKLVQYLAVGIPAVASPIGVNARILAGGQVGFAAESTAGWTEALERLLRDAPLRATMGRAGRQLVMDHYSVEANLPVLEQVLCGQQR